MQVNTYFKPKANYTDPAARTQEIKKKKKKYQNLEPKKKPSIRKLKNPNHVWRLSPVQISNAKKKKKRKKKRN